MSGTNWKTLLKEHDNLRKKSSSMIFDRITILVKVYEDPAFGAAMQKEGKYAIEVVDDKVNDTCANFTELREMLKMFPNRKQWENGNLNSMRTAMFAAVKKAKQEEREAKRQNRTATCGVEGDGNTQQDECVPQGENAEQDGSVPQDDGDEQEVCTRTRRAATLSEVRMLTEQIRAKDQEISHLKDTIACLKEQTKRDGEVIGSLREQLALMKMQRNRKVR